MHPHNETRMPDPKEKIRLPSLVQRMKGGNYLLKD
jgi:hypothetical protein